MAFWLYLSIGFFGGILGGMGMGGGTVLIPALTVFAGVEQHVAQTVNLVSFLPTAGVSLAEHKKNGVLRTDGIISIIIPAVLSSIVSSLFAVLLPPIILRKSFGAFLIFLAIKGAVELLP